jgi:hypothetical protein
MGNLETFDNKLAAALRAAGVRVHMGFHSTNPWPMRQWVVTDSAENRAAIAAAGFSVTQLGTIVSR